MCYITYGYYEVIHKKVALLKMFSNNLKIFFFILEHLNEMSCREKDFKELDQFTPLERRSRGEFITALEYLQR